MISVLTSLGIIHLTSQHKHISDCEVRTVSYCTLRDIGLLVRKLIDSPYCSQDRWWTNRCTCRLRSSEGEPVVFVCCPSVFVLEA